MLHNRTLWTHTENKASVSSPVTQGFYTTAFEYNMQFEQL